MMYTVPIYFQVTQDASTAVAGARLFRPSPGLLWQGSLGVT